MSPAKLESIITHILGQMSNFGIAEVFRTQIPLPEDLFLDKCNLSPEECLFLSKEKIPLPLYLPPNATLNQTPPVSTSLTITSSQTTVLDMSLDSMAANDDHPVRGLCRGQYFHTQHDKIKDGPIIYNSLHHYPDPICMLFGSSLVCFIASIFHWKKINPTNKGYTDVSITVRSILVLSDIGMIGSFLVYLVHLYLTYDLLQLLGVCVGVLLQVMINRIISYEHKKNKSDEKVAPSAAELKTFISRKNSAVIIKDPAAATV